MWSDIRKHILKYISTSILINVSFNIFLNPFLIFKRVGVRGDIYEGGVEWS